MRDNSLSPAQTTGTRPSLLLTTTTWWSSVAMLASSLEQAGFDVTVLCPNGHAAWSARRYCCRRLDRAQPVQSLAAAIAAVAPALVVPADDRAVQHLGQLRAGASPKLEALLTRSIGPASTFATLVSRLPLLRAGEAVGLPVPAGQEVRSLAELDHWMDRVPAPWVMKIDGAWGGEGVRFVTTREQARAAFRRLSGGLPLGLALKRKLINGDPFWMQDRRAGRSPLVSVQSFVRGRPANCALFCLDGELLGATMVEAMRCHSDSGPSTLVRVVERPAVIAGARRLVRSLGLSGFIGLDFMIDEGTDDALLIEMNPRLTAQCRIRVPAGTDPISGAAAAFGCVESGAGLHHARTMFAAFPLAWQVDPHDTRLGACVEDIPWHEPALVEEALRPLWPERGAIAGLPSQLRRFRQRIVSGRPCIDYRMKPFSWWLTSGALQPPARAAASRRPTPAESEEMFASGSNRVSSAVLQPNRL